METIQKKTGSIGVTTENIFPVIKKFLYSDHEIFLRELVSNAIDATQKLKTLSSVGEFKGELGDIKVSVKVDKEAGTLTVSDHGIGMTAADVEKYINQIAFSGAEEFVNKYKDTANGIIGHFGLGFYSAFMVSKKVEIRTLSYLEGAKAVRWECDGSPAYVLEATDKKERGTEIILYIDDDSKEFLEQTRIDTLLKKYCRFLPVEVESDGKVVNSTEPLWTKKPSDLTDEDYLKFYHDLYPGQDDPLFWIHLNVDYPFTLTGILYFPKIHNNFEITKNRIQLYCNQVFVTDSVEGVVPEFMMLLQGVIDSPDIPLNVSRSYLQSDASVKKISGYITKKVSQRLEEIFKANRNEFEEKWDDIKLFIEYGMLTDDKFRDSALKFTLLKDTEEKYFTLDEYKTLIEGTQIDSEKKVVYLYTTDMMAQYSYIEAAKSKGYSVLVMNGQLDSHFVGLLESKIENSRFVRVDSDVIDNIINDGEKKETNLTPSQTEMLTNIFKSQIPSVEKADFLVQFEAIKGNDNPVTVTQNEFMRRMKDMAAMQPGMNFYGELPDSYSLVINTEHPLINRIKNDAVTSIGDAIDKIYSELSDAQSDLAKINGEVKDNKPSDEQGQQIKDLQGKIDTARAEITSQSEVFAKSQPLIRQVIDLALLSSGLLKGQELNEFVKRSVSLL